jgi:CubicO group peptidase (beta-lactamase class C family)
VPGAYGWAGGYGTTWLTDPAEGMVSVVMTQRLMNSPDDMALNETVQTLSYQAIDD